MKSKPPTKVIVKRSSKQHSSKQPIGPNDYDYERKCFAKGHKKVPGSGMQKGMKCKFTTLKDAFVNAFQRIGGEQALVEYCTPELVQLYNKKGKPIRIIDFGPERKKEFFKMIVPMLPKEVALTGPEGAPLIPPTIIIQSSESEQAKSA